MLYVFLMAICFFSQDMMGMKKYNNTSYTVSAGSNITVGAGQSVNIVSSANVNNPVDQSFLVFETGGVRSMTEREKMEAQQERKRKQYEAEMKVREVLLRAERPKTHKPTKSAMLSLSSSSSSSEEEYIKFKGVSSQDGNAHAGEDVKIAKSATVNINASAGPVKFVYNQSGKK